MLLVVSLQLSESVLNKVTGMVRLSTAIALTLAPMSIRGNLLLLRVMLVISTPLGGTQQNMALAPSLSTRSMGNILVLSFAWAPAGQRAQFSLMRLCPALCTSRGAVRNIYNPWLVLWAIELSLTSTLSTRFHTSDKTSYH